ncbi:unnamed protein product [Pieris brassicae]|uniref:Uncharacterized protein n=1 Tax=Pieris brassicae TaxID=7116 RepID=A0A9P0T4Q9_PIEBR|nr:unnamed protein product [Pieris brassicae]
MVVEITTSGSISRVTRVHPFAYTIQPADSRHYDRFIAISIIDLFQFIILMLLDVLRPYIKPTRAVASVGAGIECPLFLQDAPKNLTMQCNGDSLLVTRSIAALTSASQVICGLAQLFI